MGLFSSTSRTRQRVRHDRPEELIPGQRSWYARQLAGLGQGAGDFGLGGMLRQAEGTMGQATSRSGVPAGSPIFGKLRSSMYTDAVNKALENKFRRGQMLASGKAGSEWSPGYTSTGKQTQPGGWMGNILQGAAGTGLDLAGLGIVKKFNLLGLGGNNSGSGNSSG